MGLTTKRCFSLSKIEILKMKVRCIRILGPDGAPQDKSPWLTIGAIYDVLTVELDRGGQWLVRVIGDARSEVALFPIESFEITSQRLPSSWVASFSSGGFFQLAPPAWLSPEFWERLYDRDPEAVNIFESERIKIEASA